MNKTKWFSVILSFVLLFGTLTGCKSGGESGTSEPTSAGKSSYTVTFDVGDEAEAAGVSTPAAQTVMRGTTAVEPTVDYWEGHDLTGWYHGSVQWTFSSDRVNEDLTLTASWTETSTVDVAAVYETNLNWGEEGHLYIHYLKGSHDNNENGLVNSSSAPGYEGAIDSAVYRDWGLWVWQYTPVNSEGRAFFPMKIDESGAVYDIDLTAAYNDAGWDSATRTNKGIEIDYRTTEWVGIQFFSQSSRLNEEGFWVNDGGDIYVDLSKALREKGDYHWFVRQGETQNGTPKYESAVVFDPYEGLEAGSAVTGYDVVSNKGNNNVYVRQPVAEGWEEESVGYEIFLASFADSDGDGMGDLQGVVSKLDYLDDLGVDVLWLTPFQQSNSYHGYDIRDYFTVDSRFGTLDDYRELVYEAHKRGMRVLLDFVLNHTSTSNPWFEKSVNLVKETVKLPDGTYKVIDYRNFYTWRNEDTVPTEGLAAAQWFRDSNGYYYYSSFGSSMPELNFDYQAVRDAILEVALYWMSFGLDGFRLDAAKHIYMENENEQHSGNIVKDISESGDYSFDMKKDAHFFMEFNAKLKASYPGAILVAENFNGDPIKIAGLYEGLDSQFNFNWYYDTTGCLGAIANGSTMDEYQYAGKSMNQYLAAQFDFSLYRTDYIDSVFTSNHDVQRARERVLSTYDAGTADWTGTGVRAGTQYEADDVALSGELAKLYAGMCMTVPGITWIYSGDELGMFGSKKANPEGDSAGHEDRWFRQPMKWTKSKADSSYNCEYSIGFNNYVMTWDSLNLELDGVAEQKENADSIYNTYKALIELRKSSKAFTRGTVTNLSKTFQNNTGNSVIVYQLTYGAECYVVYVNASRYARVPGTAPAGALVYGAGVDESGAMPALSMAVYKKS